MKQQTSVTSPTGENPFATSNGASQKSASNQNDLFGLDLNGASNAPSSKVTNAASDDLLMLSGANPFIQNIVNQSYSSQPQMGMNQVVMPNPFQASGGMMMQGVQQPMGHYQQPMMNSFPPMNPMMNNTNQNQLS